MKYRILSDEELKVLENDLKAFLIINGIQGEEWEKINKETPEKALKLVELFSDTVLDKVYQTIQFLEYRSEKTCYVFNCQKDKIDFIVLERNENSTVNLSTPESIHKALLENINELKLSKSSKSNTTTKEEHIHRLLESGCTPSVKEFWVSLLALIE